MFNPRKLFVFIALTNILSACITLPEPPPMSLRKEAVVALAIQHPKGLKHTHIGTTLFNNMEKDYLPNFDFQAVLQRKLKQEIGEKEGFKVRVLQGSIAEFAPLHDLATLNISNDWEWNKSSDEAWKKLEGGEPIDALVVITPSKEMVQVMGGCSQFGCTYWGTQYSGLFSRSFLGLDNYFWVAAVDISVFFKGQAVDLAPYINRDEKIDRFQLLKDFAGPEDFKAWTDDELRPVVTGLETFSSKVAQSIAKKLSAYRQGEP